MPRLRPCRASDCVKRVPVPRQQRDHGTAALIIVFLTIGMFAMAGLVIDGGAGLAARGRAADLAQQASRAGATALEPESLRTGTPAGLRIDRAAATRAAQQILTADGADGDITVSATTVTVTARVTRRSIVLSAFGIPTLTGTASATATFLSGTSTPDPT